MPALLISRCATVRTSPATLALMAALLMLTTGSSVWASDPPEYRAMWVSRFEWPHTNPATAQTRIDTIMQQLAAANFNAVFFQIRGQADVLYPSPDEVWSPLIGGTDPGWDPLAYAIASAHAHGLEFHAYINTHTCWQSGNGTPPANPNHLYYAHCNAADPEHRDWLHHETATNPPQYSESDYVWIAPGVPAAQAYTRAQVLYVVENYAVDGVHYDRIRTPWSNRPSYDPISLARFGDPHTNPAGLAFNAWTADQITRQVRDLYAAVMAVRPEVKVSAAVFSNPLTAPTAQLQESLLWAQTGGLDLLVPMMYFAGGAGSTWDTRLQQWLAGAGGRQVIAGHITSQGVSSLLEQITLTRVRGAHGNAVFSWSSFTGWASYPASVYAQPAPVPAQPWKDDPTSGIIVGYVTDDLGQPVVDTQITRTGSNYTALSSADGFYSFLLVPPGSYTLAAFHPGYAATAASDVLVAAGQVVHVNMDIGPVLPPILAEIDPTPDGAVVNQPYSRQLALVQGLATSWTLLAGPPGATVDAQGFVSGWTPTVADAGQTFQFTVQVINPAGEDTLTWPVLVASQPPCDRFGLTGFDDFATGTRVLFNLPRFSGSTSNHLLESPNVAVITGDGGSFSAPHACEVRWQFVDATPQRWLRLTTFNAPELPNPTVMLDRPIRIRMRLDSGRLRVAVGIRETNTDAELGANGGTSGSIEWVGAAGAVNGAPQGMLIEGQPGVWQTLIFDPSSDPIYGMTGDGTLFSATNRGVLEHIAFSSVDSAGPFTVYIDDIDFLCDLLAYGDFDGDGTVGVADFAWFTPCLGGPHVTVSGPCVAADADADTDVDLADFATFQCVFTGS